MFGPANGVGNYLALEKIYCMLVLRILAFSPPELWRQKKLSRKGEGRGHGHPRTPLATLPQANITVKRVHFTVAEIFFV